ncbi:MAG TPA: glycine betaine ABC transporter substrate-binding protein [Bacillales bacterium]
MKKLVFMLVAMIMVLSACGSGGGGDSAEGGGDPVVISGKPWTEQRILPYILADYIKAKTDIPVTVDEGVGETNVLQQAITDGDIDMYVEYTGTGYLAVLDKEFKPGQSAEEIYKTTKQAYEKQFNLTWLQPLGFQNTYSITVRQETADKYGIKKASDIVQYSKDMIFGGPATFYGRPDGYDYMVEAYGYHFKDHKSFKPGLMYKALDEGQVDVIPAFTTDARLDKYNLATTVDDKHIFPPYYAAPVVRMDVLEAYPKLAEVVNQLKGKISDEEMRHLNGLVDIKRKKPEEVAKQFLKDKGLIE